MLVFNGLNDNRDHAKALKRSDDVAWIKLLDHGVVNENDTDRIQGTGMWK